MARTFGSNHNHIQVWCRLDLAEVDIKAVRKDQGFALGHVGGNFFAVQHCLDVVLGKDLDHVGKARSLTG